MKVKRKYRIYSNTIRILFEPAPPIEPAVVLSKFPIIPAAKRAFLEIEPADCNRINTVYDCVVARFQTYVYNFGVLAHAVFPQSLNVRS